MDRLTFRQAVRIGSNVTDIMRLPCVIGCNKEFWGDTDIRYRYSLFGDTKSSRYSWGDSVYAYEGDWLCEDYDGLWHLLGDDEYRQYAQTGQLSSVKQKPT